VAGIRGATTGVPVEAIEAATRGATIGVPAVAIEAATRDGTIGAASPVRDETAETHPTGLTLGFP
jgi:hypothetical protein